jgi:hypothetical protein
LSLVIVGGNTPELVPPVVDDGDVLVVSVAVDDVPVVAVGALVVSAGAEAVVVVLDDEEPVNVVIGSAPDAAAVSNPAMNNAAKASTTFVARRCFPLGVLRAMPNPLPPQPRGTSAD